MIKKNEHLKSFERAEIEDLLNKGNKLYEIAQALNRPGRTISKEIYRNRLKKENNRYRFAEMKEPLKCEKVLKYPYVCNSCRKKRGCLAAAYYTYNAKQAQRTYEANLVRARARISLTQGELSFIEHELKKGLDKGKSIAHIITNIEGLKKYIESEYGFEDIFKVKKHFLKIRPVFLRREERIKTHILVAFLAVVLLRLLENQILNNKFSTYQIINSLREYQCAMITPNNYFFFQYDKVIRRLGELSGSNVKLESQTLSTIKKLFKNY